MNTKLPSLIDKLVGRRLHERRKALDLSQEALAERLGVTFQQIQKYENGLNRISAGRLYELAQELGTSISSFYDGADELTASIRRGVAEEGARFDGPPDAECIDLVIAFRSIRKPEIRKSLLAAATKEASASVRSRRTRG